MCVLAVWRLTHLLAREDGPEDLIVRLRVRLGDRVLGRAMDCFYCLSVWIALPFALLLPGGWLDRVLGWLALSGAACLLEKLTEKEHQEEVYVLRSKKSGDGEPDGVPPVFAGGSDRVRQ
jgi:hypothetical protein